jgi:dCMP deaminase
MSKWHNRFIGLAKHVATWSKDSTQVGAVIVDSNRNPRGFGYNGMPRNLNDDDITRHQQPLKKLYWEHAERNVVYACARNGISCDDCTLYTTHWPCCDCARAIIQSGITTLVVSSDSLDPSSTFFQKWNVEIQESKNMLEEAGIECLVVDYIPET